ncbi:MAG TPA: RNA polymerase sigma factor [Mycobacteriales bacterium]|nr:RNA polymerase sigma factor [Mycobacteriales bacterium]
MERDGVPDQALAAAVDDALLGDILAGLPEAQPGRALGSPSDFSSLYVRHRSGLAAHARRYLRDPRDVDEVVQETFLRLFLAISEIETEIQAIAFARRTLTNLCIDRYRADRRRPTLITLDASPFFDLNGAEEDPDPVLQAEDAAIVRDALARLSPLHRAALVKREIEEKPLPQIAAELGIAEDSVKHLLFRARRALRRLLVGTTVEPGVDPTGLSPRNASPLLRGAGVLILFLVAAIVAATGLRPLLSGSSKGGSDGGTVAGGVPSLNLPGLGGPGGTAAPKPQRAPAAHHHHAGGSVSTVPSLSVGISAPPATTHKPVSKQPARPAPFGAHAPRSHYRLNGPLEVTGAPHITPGGFSRDTDGATVASSSFSAPTNQGTFELNQSVSTASDAGTTVTVTPAFVVGGAVQQPQLTGSAAAVGTASNGDVTVDVVAGAQPAASTNAFPLTGLAAHLELTPDLSQVLSETVTLSTQRPAPPAPGAGAATTPGGSTGASQPGAAPAAGTTTAQPAPTTTSPTPTTPTTAPTGPPASAPPGATGPAAPAPVPSSGDPVAGDTADPGPAASTGE